jgi:predicted metalloendopeptidase
MTETIISALRDTLDQVTWMDVRSKKLAREKVDNIKARVAYPDNIFNNAYLDSLYEVRDINLFSNCFFI